VVPLTLALAMLAVVVVAGLLPDAGVVSAASNCTYGNCPAASPFPLWAVSTAVVVVLLALVLALLLLRRGRRRPPAEAAPSEGQAPEAPAGPEGSAEEPPAPTSWDEASGSSSPSADADEGAPPSDGA
jgi:hypothetical protein